MNKTALTIGTAVVGGALSKGVTGMIEVSNPIKIAINLAMCAGSAYLASNVKGADSKAAALVGAYTGVAVAQGLEALKNISQTPAIADKLDSSTKLGRFGQKALGLNGGVNGYFDQDNNYHEDGLAGYITPSGEVVSYATALNAYNDGDGLAGTYFDENGNEVSDGLNAIDVQFHEEGLAGYDDDEDGLGGYEDDEDGLGAYDDDEDGLGVYEEDFE